MGRQRAPVDPAKLAGLEVPVLIVLGEKDDLAGSGEKLAAAIPGARLEIVPGDHITAVAAPRYKEVVLDFLAEVRERAKARPALYASRSATPVRPSTDPLRPALNSWRPAKFDVLPRSFVADQNHERL